MAIEQRIPSHSNDGFASLFLIIRVEIEVKRWAAQRDSVISGRILTTTRRNLGGFIRALEGLNMSRLFGNRSTVISPGRH